MSPRRLATCLLTLGWSIRELARRTGEHRTQIERCLQGRAVLDPVLAHWLDQLVAAHEALPCPRRRTALFLME